METLNIEIGGMGGRHCVRVVHNTVSSIPATEIKHIEVGKAEVNYDPGMIGKD